MAGQPGDSSPTHVPPYWATRRSSLTWMVEQLRASELDHATDIPELLVTTGTLGTLPKDVARRALRQARLLAGALSTGDCCWGP